MTVSDIRTADGVLHITFKLPRRQRPFPFEGKVPTANDQPILGTVGVGSMAEVVVLERTTLKTLDDSDDEDRPTSKLAFSPEMFAKTWDELRTTAKSEEKLKEVRTLVGATTRQRNFALLGNHP